MTPAVRIIAPSHRLTTDKKHAIQAYLRSVGITPLFPEIPRHRRHITEDSCDGPAAAVFTDLYRALTQPHTPLIWAARGGSGSARLFPYIRYYRQRIATAPPKIIAGYSDTTCLLNVLARFPQFTCVHASTLSELSRGDAGGVTDMPERMAAAAQSADPRYLQPMPNAIVGVALNKAAAHTHFPEHAPKEGGNLTLIQSSLGTAWQIPAIPGSVLVVEDLAGGIDYLTRLTEHIYQATQGLRGCIGIICGDVNSAFDEHGHKIYEGDTERYLDVIRRLADRCRLPLWKGAVGHGALNTPFFIGRTSFL